MKFKVNGYIKLKDDTPDDVKEMIRNLGYTEPLWVSSVIDENNQLVCLNGGNNWFSFTLFELDLITYEPDTQEAPQKLLNAVDILEQGKGILNQRGEEYEASEGTGERSFNSVATAFNAITGKDLTPAEVCLVLQIVKDVRQWSQDRLHADSILDCTNYAALKGEELYKQYRNTSND